MVRVDPEPEFQHLPQSSEIRPYGPLLETVHVVPQIADVMVIDVLRMNRSELAYECLISFLDGVYDALDGPRAETSFDLILPVSFQELHELPPFLGVLAVVPRLPSLHGLEDAHAREESVLQDLR